MSATTESTSDFTADRLRPVLSERFAMTWVQTTVCAVGCVFFLYLSYIPLFYTDIWCHVHYGQWILEHGSLPTEDPFMPLAEGMKLVDSAWLAQVVFAQLIAWGGPNLLSVFYAFVVFATYLILARVFYLQGGHSWLALFGGVLVLGIGWTRHAIVRPEIFGGLAFASLFWLLVQTEPWRTRAAGMKRRSMPDEAPIPLIVWLCVPPLFALWANLHGSFMVGLAALGCHALGCLIETAWRTKGVGGVIKDPAVRAWVLLCELALAATLLNPYGFSLIIEALTFGKNENLRDVLEWFPLQLIFFEGILFSVAVIWLFVLTRHSRERMRVADVLLLLVFAAAVAPATRMIGWFAQVFAFVTIPLAADLWRRLCPRELASPEPPAARGTPARRFILSLVCLLFIWCAFALSPASQHLLGGKGRGEDRVYSQDTPRAAARFLRENPPTGLVFCPQWWGDWLAWDGPPDLQVFMTSFIHVTPKRVWKDYLQVARGEAGWESTLDRYGVTTLVVHKQLQVGLSQSVRRTANWQVAFEDDKAIVLNRKESK